MRSASSSVHGPTTTTIQYVDPLTPSRIGRHGNAAPLIVLRNKYHDKNQTSVIKTTGLNDADSRVKHNTDDIQRKSKQTKGILWQPVCYCASLILVFYNSESNDAVDESDIERAPPGGTISSGPPPRALNGEALKCATKS